MKICIGYGNDGEILEDPEKAKACNYCTKFISSHWLSGYCKEKDKRLTCLDYRSEAKWCNEFECCPELIRYE